MSTSDPIYVAEDGFDMTHNGGTLEVSVTAVNSTDTSAMVEVGGSVSYPGNIAGDSITSFIDANSEASFLFEFTHNQDPGTELEVCVSATYAD